MSPPVPKAHGPEHNDDGPGTTTWIDRLIRLVDLRLRNRDRRRAARRRAAQRLRPKKR